MATEQLEEVRRRNHRKISAEQSKLMSWIRRHTTAAEEDARMHLSRYAESAFMAGAEMGRAEVRIEAHETWHQNKLLKGLCSALVIMTLALGVYVIWLG